MNVKEAKKMERKVKRALDIMNKDYPNVHRVEQNISEILFLGNYGLMTEVSFEDLTEVFIRFGTVTDVVLLPGKSYSFVKYSSSSEASKALLALQNSILFDGNPPLLVTTVDSCPEQTEIEEDEFSSLPPGLSITENFVDSEVESDILSSLNWKSETETKLKNRKVQHFGYEFVYGNNSIDRDRPIRPIPEQWRNILSSFPNFSADSFDQCTVNRYEPGQGIPPHVDSHGCCGPIIAVLSLGSDVVMNFIPCISSSSSRAIKVTIPRRSLMIMSGKSRYAYRHGIVPRVSDVSVRISDEKRRKTLTLIRRHTRVSLTFRQRPLGSRCDCDFPDFCDDRISTSNDDRNESVADRLESIHVHSVYEEISDHFSETRHKPWPKVMEFLDKVIDGGMLLDVGCGNGKYLGHHPGMIQVGCDYSQGLLGIVRSRGFLAVRSNCLKLPFKSEIFDAFICIAVIHHLSTPKRRLEAIIEMTRILKPGTGRGLIYAWAKEQNRNSNPSSYLKKKKFDDDNDNAITKDNSIEKTNTSPLFSLPVHQNRTNFRHSDLLVPWKKKDSTTYHRYYHVFEENELERLIRSVEGLHIDLSYYDQGNWCVVVRKTT